MKRIRKSGPQGVVRPFQPSIEVATSLPMDEKQLETLEHIATSLSAIDHNIEKLTETLMQLVDQNKRR
ncbi:hypothetical protein [Hoeflea sp. TYP-13]|uniref:hypothetical protein n=1 Tax=Hoeflea sp. TYP-13 TaxID=3230023 RepID=UPI0034C62062